MIIVMPSANINKTKNSIIYNAKKSKKAEATMPDKSKNNKPENPAKKNIDPNINQIIGISDGIIIIGFSKYILKA